jgi:hypothetical protein
MQTVPNHQARAVRIGSAVKGVVLVVVWPSSVNLLGNKNPVKD